MATLSDVIDQLKETNKSQEENTQSIAELSKDFKSWFKYVKRGQLQAEESRREASKAKGGFLSEQFKAGQEAGSGFGLGGLLTNPATYLAPILGAAAAVTGAFGAFEGGLRGWEGSMLTKLRTGLDGLARSVLIGFGIDPLTGELDAAGRRRLNGRFYAGETKPTSTMVIEGLGKLKTQILTLFGIAEDGSTTGLARVRQLLGLSDETTLLGRITSSVSRIFSPLISFVGGVTSWVAGSGAKLLGFLDEVFGISKATGSLMGGGATLFRALGKILFPLGFLLSVYDGVKAYQESDADGVFARLGAGLGGFLGSFFGAPFDLLKSAIGWIIEKSFGLTRDADGNIAPGQGVPGWIVTKLESFSIQETISSIVSGIFSVVQGAVDWVKTLFTDPATAFSQLWTGTVAALGWGLEGAVKLTDILYWPMNTFIDWIGRKFGWVEEDAPKFNIVQFIADWGERLFRWVGSLLPDVSGIVEDLKARVMAIAPEWLKDWLADYDAGTLGGRLDPSDYLNPANEFAGVDGYGDSGQSAPATPTRAIPLGMTTGTPLRSAADLLPPTAAEIEAYLARAGGGAPVIVQDDHSTRVTNSSPMVLPERTPAPVDNYEWVSP